MCTTCGCGSDSNHHHHHHHDHDGHHTHIHSHHDNGSSPEAEATVHLEEDILGVNNRFAESNRAFFTSHGIFSVNLVSSPGSGKTSLLEATLERLAGRVNVAVIEGDQQTTNDADRIKAKGAKAVQINTMNGCHLDAHMVAHAAEDLELEPSTILFIENVGNLVCPAMFDLGEQERVVVISVTEGDDKPLKYPYMFAGSAVCVINKIDLLPYVDCDLDRLKNNALKVNPNLRFFELSATRGQGMEQWCDYLLARRAGC